MSVRIRDFKEGVEEFKQHAQAGKWFILYAWRTIALNVACDTEEIARAEFAEIQQHGRDIANLVTLMGGNSNQLRAELTRIQDLFAANAMISEEDLVIAMNTVAALLMLREAQDAEDNMYIKLAKGK